MWCRSCSHIFAVTLASCNVEKCERQQIPLKLSWAVTIHKSQELIMQKTIAELGPTEKVVSRLSRVKNLPDFMVEPTSFDRC